MVGRRVVITGIGPVTPIGVGVDDFWTGATSGRNGIGPITRFDASAFSTRIAGEVKGFDPLDFIDKKDVNGLIEAGARMDEACENCHLKYWYPNDKPSQRGVGGLSTVGAKAVRVMPTLHPAYLLRQPAQKRLAWRDLLSLRQMLDAH